MSESTDRAAADLAADTRVTRLEAAPGWYTAELPPHWNFRTPSGGVLMTVAMRAMVAELGDPTYRPTSANTLFCSAVPDGPLEIRVEVLRRSGAAAQVRAALSSTTLPGPGLEVSATFTRERKGPSLTDSRFPSVPAPADAEPFTEASQFNPHVRFAFFHNLETRLGLGERWWIPGWKQMPEARFARWFRYRVPQLGPNGVMDPLAIPPIADTMPPSLIQVLGPTGPMFHAPSLDLTVHFLEDTASEWLLVESHARHARAGYASAEVEIWSEDRRLIAYGTQTMMLREVGIRRT